MPASVSSSSDDSTCNSCAASGTFQGKRRHPRSSRFDSKQKRVLSQNKLLTKFARFVRKTKTCPERGLSWRTEFTSPSNPSKLFLSSTASTATNIFTDGGSVNMSEGLPIPP